MEKNISNVGQIILSAGCNVTKGGPMKRARSGENDQDSHAIGALGTGREDVKAHNRIYSIGTCSLVRLQREAYAGT